MLIFKSGQSLPVGLVDVVSNMLLNYNNKSQTQLKQEAIYIAMNRLLSRVN